MQTETLVRDLIGFIGEDPDRKELRKTPARVTEMWQHITRGYRTEVAALLKDSVCDEPYSQMIMVRDINYYSICEHHLLPFFGKAHVAYIPNGKMIGLSKIPRLVDAFACRLQIQERLTNQIAEALQDTLKPHGVAVVIEATHLCMQMRGIEKQNSVVTTSALFGSFREDERSRNEFLHLVGQPRVH